MAFRDMMPWRGQQQRPLENMRGLVESMEKVLSESLVPSRLFSGKGELDAKVSLKETPKTFEVTAELPGFSKEEVEIEVGDSGVTIRAESRLQSRRRHGRGEESYRALTRSFVLPAQIKPQEAKARFSQGKLAIELPKAKESMIRRVKID